MFLINLLPASAELIPFTTMLSFIDEELSVELVNVSDVKEHIQNEMHIRVTRNTFNPVNKIEAEIFGYLRLRNNITGRTIHFMIPLSKDITIHGINNNELVTKFAETSTVVAVRITENHLPVIPSTEYIKDATPYFTDGTYINFAAGYSQLALVDGLGEDAKELHVFFEGLKMPLQGVEVDVKNS